MTFNAYAHWADGSLVDEVNPILVVRSIEPHEIIDIFAGYDDEIVEMFEERYGNLSHYLLDDNCS